MFENGGTDSRIFECMYWTESSESANYNTCFFEIPTEYVFHGYVWKVALKLFLKH